MAGHVEGDGVGVPGGAQVAERLAVDHQRFELVLRGGRCRCRHGRRQQQVGVAEQPLHRLVGGRAVDQGTAQRHHVDGIAFVQGLGEGRVEIAAATLQDLAETLDLVGAQDDARDIELPVDLAAVHFAEPRALLVEEGKRGVEARLGVGIEVAAGHAADHGDALAGDRMLAAVLGPGERRAADRVGPGIVVMAARHRGEASAEIGRMARHHAEIGELAELVGGGLMRHAAERRLEAVDAAAGGRDAARAGAVGRHRDGTEAERHGDSGAAARSARRMMLVPRVARDAVQAAVGQDLVAELRRRRLGEQDSIGLAPLGDGIGIHLGHIVLHRERREGGAQPLGQNQVLGGNRHAGQLAEAGAALAPGVERIGRCAGAVGIEGGDGVERLGLLDARQHALDQVAGGNLAGGEGFDVLGDGAARKIPGGDILGGHDPAFSLRRRGRTCRKARRAAPSFLPRVPLPAACRPSSAR